MGGDSNCDYARTDELRGPKGNLLREWAHVRGCLLLTPEHHWVLCEQIHFAMVLLETKSDPAGALNVLQRVMDDLEEDWKTGAIE
jgi:hypothetical protein